VYVYIKRGDYLNPTFFSTTIRSQDSFPTTGLPLTNIDFAPGEMCTLSGCGYSRGGEFASDALAYKNAHPSFGFVQRPLPCSGGCTAPDVSGSVSPKGFDRRYVRAFTDTEHNIYTNAPSSRGIPFEYLTNDPQYTWSVHIRSEIQWVPNCPYSRQDVIDHEPDVKNVKKAQTVLLVFSIISFIVLTLLFGCLHFVKPEVAERYSTAHTVSKVIIKGAMLGATIATAVIAHRTLTFWDSINGKGGSLPIPCSDPLTDETFMSLGDKFRKLSLENIINAASIGVTSLVDLVVQLGGKVFGF